MAKPLIDSVLLNARTLVADRRLRLRGAEAVTADGRECDACDDDAQRFCAVGALIRTDRAVGLALPARLTHQDRHSGQSFVAGPPDFKLRQCREPRSLDG